jgi:3-oxosteroid 1-dehydrogenase
MIEDADVVVAGSGAGGLVAALRAHDLGLKVRIVEKAHFYGGTSATSGGVMWIPGHGLDGLADSPEQALTYLKHVTRGQVGEARLRAFVDGGPRMLAFLRGMGFSLRSVKGFPDYFPDAPGSVPGRSVFLADFDARELGPDFLRMREPLFQSMLFGRYSLDMRQFGALVVRPPGWPLVVARLILKYWLDLPQRLRSRRDRRTTRGAALIGTLMREVIRRKIPLHLNTALQELVVEDGRVTGAVVEREGRRETLLARHGVILAAGGFEHNQAFRDAHLPVKTATRWSLTPAGGNTGDALSAATAIGADTEFMDCMWWAPVMQLPWDGLNRDVAHSMTNDQKHPHSIMVNQRGVRFVNESCSYDQFGIAMVEDQKRGGGNVPCWLVFDANYRERYVCGGLMPNILTPDSRVPAHWWDQYIYRAGTIAELAGKIGVPAVDLNATVETFNRDAARGVDTAFGRGSDAYDRHWGDQKVKPNPCLAPIDKAPFYAVRIDLGDLGCKGGVKADANGQVVHRDGRPIPGLYAVGNASGSAFGDCYPGGGGTIGPAATFGFIAAEHVAAQVNRKSEADRLARAG